MLEKLPEGVGHALQNQRAGLDSILTARLRPAGELKPLEVASPAFVDQATIPVAYTADGEGLSPPLAWGGVPAEAGCVAIIVEDADSPTPHPLVHAIALIAPVEGYLSVGDMSAARLAEGRLSLGINSYLKRDWLPPDPPPGHGPHRYVFQVFALSNRVGLSDSPGRSELERALQEHVIAAGHLTGVYERPARVSASREEAVQAPAVATQRILA